MLTWMNGILASSGSASMVAVAALLAALLVIGVVLVLAMHWGDSVKAGSFHWKRHRPSAASQQQRAVARKNTSNPPTSPESGAEHAQ